jgi:hypothetical protein
MHTLREEQRTADAETVKREGSGDRRSRKFQVAREQVETQEKVAQQAGRRSAKFQSGRDQTELRPAQA